MHAFQNYMSKNKVDKEKMISKYYGWIADLFRMLEVVINTIDSKNSDHVLTSFEVNRFGLILYRYQLFF